MTAPMTAQQKKAWAALHAHCLSLPGAREDFPWGHSAMKAGPSAKAKVFAFLVNGTMKESSDAVGLSVKLPVSAGQALSLPFAAPTGYGLGKAGWVSLSFNGTDDVPVDILLPWITESYRAIAPKTLVKQLDGAAPAPKPKAAAKPKTTKAKKKRAKKKPAKKK